MSFIDKRFTLFSTSDSEVWVYTIEVEASLAEYPSKTISTSFKVTITPCVVTQLNPVSTVLDPYDIGLGPHTYNLNEFTLTPSCGYDITYQLQLVNSNGSRESMSGFFTDDAANYQFVVESLDVNSAGTYQIAWIGSIDSFSEEVILSLEFDQGSCKAEVITTTQPIV